MSSPDNVEVPFGFVCYWMESTSTFDHGRRLMALVADGVLNRDATVAHLAWLNELGHRETVSVAEIAPAGRLLPRGARPIAWVDPSGVRYLEGRECDVTPLVELVCALGAGRSPERATVVGTDNVWLAELRSALEWAWSADTSAAQDWTPTNPSRGQCAVTAMVVQDRFGGELLRVVNEGESHYFNRLNDGTEVDLTRDQFEVWDPSPAEVRPRDYLEAHADTVHRHMQLCGQLSEHAQRSLDGTL